MIEDTLSQLVRCETCGHSTTQHDLDGCRVFHCLCASTHERVMHENLAAVALERHGRWSGPASSVADS